MTTFTYGTALGPTGKVHIYRNNLAGPLCGKRVATMPTSAVDWPRCKNCQAALDKIMAMEG